jgi:hypothetical protein
MGLVHPDQQQSDDDEKNQEYEQGSNQVNIATRYFIYKLSEHDY